ncbi:MAG: FAD-dependent oxidoreductase [Akkermansiaceae bacterium]
MNSSDSKPNPLDRRSFITQGAASLAGLSLASTTEVSLAKNSESVSGPNGQDLADEIDVLVVGGGSAGTIAAIQAGRAGARTVVMERASFLGGMTTRGGVCFPGLFDAWGKQIIAGIGWELVKECVELDGGTLPDFSKVQRRHWMNQVHINQYLFYLLAEEKCAQAGVKIAYHEFPQTIKKTTTGWQVDCVGFGTRRRVLCKQIVDCTGGAEIAGMLAHPRLREDERQPGSIQFLLGHANDPGRPVKSHGAGLLHAIYVHGADSTNSRTVTEASLTGRKAVLAKMRKTGERLMHLQPEPGFRESYRIEGETVISVQDYKSGRLFEDAVCYAFYPVDLHTKNGVKPVPLKPGTVPTIPLSALIPKGSKNIIVAGRCVSSDRLANSGLRVQAPCMAMGQAAACAAAIAAKDGTTPGKVPLDKLHTLLKEHGAIVPEKKPS